MPINDQLKLTLIQHINSTPFLLSAFTDRDMLPEQAEDSEHLSFILGAAYFHKFMLNQKEKDELACPSE